MTKKVLPYSSGQTKIINATSQHASDFKAPLSSESNNSNVIDQLEFKANLKSFQKPKTEVISTISGIKTGNQFQLKLKSDPKKVDLKFQTLFQNSNNGNFNLLSKSLEKMIIDKRKDELVNNLKLVDSNIVDITSFSNNMIYVDIGAKSLIPSNLMGDGFLKFLNIITNMYEVQGGVMLVDEIDNGLHYKTLKNLWRILITTAKRLRIQLFVTTHSKEALIYLKEVLEET